MKICKKLLSLFLMLSILFGVLPTLTAVSTQETAQSNENSMDTKENAEKSQPKVSVVVAVYNTEPYLRECLDSIKNQTLKEIEIIVK